MTNGTIQVVDEGPMTALRYLTQLREVFEKEFLSSGSSLFGLIPSQCDCEIGTTIRTLW